MYRIGVCWMVAALLGLSAAAQEPKPKFEVASVKPVRGQLTLLQVVKDSWGSQGGALRLAGVTVEALMRHAYGLERYQILDGPDWVRTDTFAIDARPGTAVSVSESKRMLQSLLEDRFRLISHDDRRDMKFYALAMKRTDGRFGPYIRQFGDICTSEMSTEAKKKFPTHVIDADGLKASFIRGNCSDGLSTMAQQLTIVTKDLPVRDETGLRGRFTYDMSYISSGNLIANVKDALEEQLGLTLVAKRAPIPVRVIDSISRPAEN